MDRAVRHLPRTGSRRSDGIEALMVMHRVLTPVSRVQVLAVPRDTWRGVQDESMRRSEILQVARRVSPEAPVRVRTGRPSNGMACGVVRFSPLALIGSRFVLGRWRAVVPNRCRKPGQLQRLKVRLLHLPRVPASGGSVGRSPSAASGCGTTARADNVRLCRMV